MNQYTIIIFFLLGAFKSQAQKSIYTSQNFLLQLEEDNSFIFYSKELSLELSISGTTMLHSDSLILTTHKIDEETAVFAIFLLSSNHLTNVFKQKEFYNSIPNKFYLLKKMHANGSIAQENYWSSFEKGQYEKFEFDENKYILAKQNYKHFKLNGKQFIFLGNKESSISFELNYKNGKLQGKSYYYKAFPEKKQVQIIKIEKYKRGQLKKTKKPVKPPVFYTNHF